MKSLIAALALALPLAAAELPQPVVVDPGGPQKAPSDAVVLFDGSNLEQWARHDGSAPTWKVENGEIVLQTRTGSLMTKRKFGDFQLHIEFATPKHPDAKGQSKGNSGVYLQGRYELQVLDSFENPTYADGSAGSFYLQSAPAVNVSRRPGEWQSYDVIFHAPKCFGDNFMAPATVTVLHNGVVVQDHFALEGPTGGAMDQNVCQPGPILLQDHGDPEVPGTAMRFRNVWIRPL